MNKHEFLIVLIFILIAIGGPVTCTINAQYVTADLIKNGKSLSESFCATSIFYDCMSKFK